MEEKIIIYDEKSKSPKEYLIFVFMACMSFLVAYAFCANSPSKIPIAAFIAGLVGICFIWSAISYKKYDEKRIKNILEIKNNGNMTRGEVIHILREHKRHSSKISTTTRFLVRFKDKELDEKLVFTPMLPKRFDNISIKKASEEDNLKEINMKQKENNGYIEIDENYNALDKNTMSKEELFEHRMDGGVFVKNVFLNNFEHPIICNVYDLNGKYVIDDFESKLFYTKKMSSTESFLWWIIILGIFLILIGTVVIYFENPAFFENFDKMWYNIR